LPGLIGQSSNPRGENKLRVVVIGYRLSSG
jgi:hypothetical protein